MRIQHNIMAMNAYRNYGNNTSALSGNLEKLSSGYKINRAGDDAAGLAISEKMRAQITGLEGAQKNVKDGISLVKTAEGAMQEVQDMLNRMSYLAEQSANGTYDDGVDRVNLQKEVNSLMSEIDRIADSANFNGIKLMDGTQTGIEDVKFTQGASGVKASFTITFTSGTQAVKNLLGGTIQIGSKTWTIKAGSAASTSVSVAGTVIKIGGKVTKMSKVVSKIKAELTKAGLELRTEAGSKVDASITVSGCKLIIKCSQTNVKIDVTSLPTYGANGGLQLQIGDTAHTFNQMRVGINDIHTKKLFMQNDIDISSQSGATKAMNFIKNAINVVSSTRGDLGAIQNRLDHTMNNLSVMTENIQDAESTIRDTDVADEMMAYTKNNILIQSAQAMLAQANTVPQGVLQLLQ